MTNPVRNPAPLATADGWTVGSLRELQANARVLGGDLERLSAASGLPRRACDIALNSLAGRTPPQAFKALLAHEAALSGDAR